MRAAGLVVTDPDGTERRFGPAGAPAQGRIEVRDRRFYRRLVTHADIGLGDAWMDGDWDSPDLPGTLAALARDRDAIERGPRVPSRLRRLWTGGVRGHGSNTPGGSRDNVRDHYDLGNRFFRLFLDEGMTYSAGRWLTGGEDLAAAQANKLAAARRRARIGPGTRVLEIGSGWGSFALAAAAAGADVTGLTLSTEQHALATERVARAGLADRARFEVRDYRAARGEYDAIVSIEMLEAVGHRYYGAFFRACDRLLRPGGRAAIQVILLADARYERYRRGFDWIQRRIFPGGLVPSLAVLRAAMARHSRLAIEEVERFGGDYARTLAEWRGQLLAAAPEAARLGHPRRFLRAWDYYFAYCEAGFRTGELDVVQMTLARPGE
jgi:cyclopropane-fatty-acyl-phospholipid synthase